MFIIFPKCSFKCDKEANCEICQNSHLAKEPIINYSVNKIVERYKTNPITKAVVCGGLEPFDTLDDLTNLISTIRRASDDDIVIYTGYKEEEIFPVVENLISKYKNIIIKYGRYIPNQESKYDKILGITLASNNQYAVRY